MIEVADRQAGPEIATLAAILHPGTVLGPPLAAGRLKAAAAPIEDRDAALADVWAAEALERADHEVRDVIAVEVAGREGPGEDHTIDDRRTRHLSSQDESPASAQPSRTARQDDDFRGVLVGHPDGQVPATVVIEVAGGERERESPVVGIPGRLACDLPLARCDSPCCAP